MCCKFGQMWGSSKVAIKNYRELCSLDLSQICQQHVVAFISTRNLKSHANLWINTLLINVIILITSNKYIIFSCSYIISWLQLLHYCRSFGNWHECFTVREYLKNMSAYNVVMARYEPFINCLHTYQCDRWSYQRIRYLGRDKGNLCWYQGLSEGQKRP